MPSPPLNRRIDYFAMTAMEALLSSKDIEVKLEIRSNLYGHSKEEELAMRAYDIAEIMEAEAGNH